MVLENDMAATNYCILTAKPLYNMLFMWQWPVEKMVSELYIGDVNM